jgi:hypothetical protein
MCVCVWGGECTVKYVEKGLLGLFYLVKTNEAYHSPTISAYSMHSIHICDILFWNMCIVTGFYL